MFTGVVPEDFLGHEPWQFLVKTLFCTRLLMDVNWRLLVRAWPTERGAPLPVPAVMDLLANLYNAENPTQLPVRPHAPPVSLRVARGHPAQCACAVMALGPDPAALRQAGPVAAGGHLVPYLDDTT